MTPTTVRRLGFSLAFLCSLTTAYCGLASTRGHTQTPAARTVASAQKSPGQPAVTAPIARTPPAAVAVTSASPPGKDGIDGDTVESDDHTGITTCRNWIYTRGDMVMSGATARFNRKMDTLDTDYPVVMDDSKHHLTADKAHVEHVDKDKSQRLVVLTGHAVMVLKPENAAASGEVPPAPAPAPGSSVPGKLKVVSITSQPPGASGQGQGKHTAPLADARTGGAKPPAEDKDREDAKAQQRHGGTVTCDKIEYKTARKFSTLTGHVVFKQSFSDKDGKLVERSMTCEHAENDGKANTLHLFKPVHFEDNDGQTGDTKDDVFVGTKEGEETLKMVGHTHLTFTSPDEDDDSDDSKSTKGTLPKDTIHAADNGTNNTSQ